MFSVHAAPLMNKELDGVTVGLTTKLRLLVRPTVPVSTALTLFGVDHKMGHYTG